MPVLLLLQQWATGSIPLLDVRSSADGGHSLQPRQCPPIQGPRWGVFNLAAYRRQWDVPWGGKEIVGGMALWAAVFAAVAFLIVPLVFVNSGSKVSRQPPMRPQWKGWRATHACSNLSVQPRLRLLYWRTCQKHRRLGEAGLQSGHAAPLART